MQLNVLGQNVYAAGGGRAHVAGRPLAVLLHGAGMDHTVWALQNRWLAFHGWNVLAVDLPGHGKSPGPALTSIDVLARWTLALVAAAGAAGGDAGKVTLIGHSMGSLVALRAASLAPASW